MNPLPITPDDVFAAIIIASCLLGAWFAEIDWRRELSRMADSNDQQEQ